MDIVTYLGSRKLPNGKQEIYIKIYLKGTTQRSGTGIFVESRHFERAIDAVKCKKIGLNIPRNVLYVTEEDAMRFHYVLLEKGVLVSTYARNGAERVELLAAMTKLEMIKDHICEMFKYMKINNQEFPKDWLKTVVMGVCETGFAPKCLTKVWNIFDLLDRYMDEVRMSPDHLRSFRLTEHLLFRYECYTNLKTGYFRLNKKSLNKETIEGFRKFLKEENELIRKEPRLFEKIFDQQRMRFSNRCFRMEHVDVRSNNYIVTLLGRLRSFFTWLVKQGELESNPFSNVTIGMEHYGTPYYLSLEERNRLADYDMSDYPELSVQRDIFIFQCCIGCRVGDLMRLTCANVVDDVLEYYPNKTKETFANLKLVRVPLNDRAKDILKRYANNNHNGLLLPFITSQAYNRALKKIFTICGINRIVTILDPKTNMEKQVALNEIASSHLARRTFIGNLYKRVKDPNLICPMSGHTYGSKAFSRYHDVDDDVRRQLVGLLE